MAPAVFDHLVCGVALLPGDEVDALGGPFVEEFVVAVGPVAGYDAALRLCSIHSNRKLFWTGMTSTERLARLYG